ncbi:Hypothetical predicted protein [Octopus vulgaris]|uniref:Uncharacterized protein n=1 Tax=Octopus vulgaris TaxID=6645 RepID=A0AA36BA38_OCTVU|nr:Hypothetical predicted protein [Octopus vulgaris]
MVERILEELWKKMPFLKAFLHAEDFLPLPSVIDNITREKEEKWKGEKVQSSSKSENIGNSSEGNNSDGGGGHSSGGSGDSGCCSSSTLSNSNAILNTMDFSEDNYATIEGGVGSGNGRIVVARITGVAFTAVNSLKDRSRAIMRA